MNLGRMGTFSGRWNEYGDEPQEHSGKIDRITG